METIPDEGKLLTDTKKQITQIYRRNYIKNYRRRKAKEIDDKLSDDETHRTEEDTVVTDVLEHGELVEIEEPDLKRFKIESESPINSEDEWIKKVRCMKVDK